MGAGPSYEHDYHRAQHEAHQAREHSKWLQSERDRIQAESHARDLRNAEEARKREEEARKREREAHEREKEAQRLQAEKDRIQAELHAEELRKKQEEMRKMQEEKERLQKEAHEKELKRIAEAHRLEQEALKLKEKLAREAEKKKMEEHAKKIEEDARLRVEKEVWLREEAERNLEKGIPAVKYPTGEEFEATRKRLQYKDGNLHFAVTGVSGVGKSSLINAFRGCSNAGADTDPNIAKTGTSETTEEIGRYCDPVRPWLVWYDVPGAGTLKVPGWQYFNDQGLYIFDIVIIVIGDRFTRIDVDLLFNCKRFGIPAFVVRSKANMHVRNIMADDGDADDEEYNPERLSKAIDKFVTDTRRSFKSILDGAGLPSQNMYIVSNTTVRDLMKDPQAQPKMMIDEIELMDDVVNIANTRGHQIQPPQV